MLRTSRYVRSVFFFKRHGDPFSYDTLGLMWAQIFENHVCLFFVTAQKISGTILTHEKSGKNRSTESATIFEGNSAVVEI